jgi:hypothetical protein
MKAVLIDQSKVGLDLFVDSARCQTAQRRGVSACGVSCSASEQVVGLGMALHVGRGVSAQRADCLVSLADVGKHATHQLGSEVLAPMLGVGLDMGDRHHVVTQQEVGERDDRSVEQQLVPIVARAALDGEAIMFFERHGQSLAGRLGWILC